MRGYLLIVVLRADNAPVPLGHGLETVREILLGEECLLILGDLVEVLLTRLDHLRNVLEAVTCADLILRQRSRTFVRVRLTDVETATIRVGGRGYPVRTEEVITMVVSVNLFFLFERTANGLDTRRITSYCHKISAFAEGIRRMR